MDEFPTEEFDAIILGTGLKECILSGLLSKAGKKVLHMDRNDYYGAESASLNLTQMMRQYANEEKVDEKTFGRARDYCIDQCPKFILGCGDLVKMLIHSGVTRYLEFKHVGGSFVYNTNKLYEVPVTAKAALVSPLLGVFQRVRVTMFFKWIAGYAEEDKKTWDKVDPFKNTMKEIYEYFKVDEGNQTFIGHVIALYTNDAYLEDVKETRNCLAAIQLYAFSLAKYKKSPYIYPIYGLGGLPEGFSRLSAVHGSVYMLRYPLDKIIYDDNGQAVGIETKGNKAKLSDKGVIIGDPSYFMDTLDTKAPKIKKRGRTARWICILATQPPAIPKKDCESAQIIIPGKLIGRPSDIYVSVQSNNFAVAPKGRYIATISSNVYTDNPKQELRVAFKMLGKPLQEFFFTSDTYFPINDPRKENVYITSSMDATSHFQSATKEVMMLYKLVTGRDVDLSSKPEDVNKEEE